MPLPASLTLVSRPWCCFHGAWHWLVVVSSESSGDGALALFSCWASTHFGQHRGVSHFEAGGIEAFLGCASARGWAGRSRKERYGPSDAGLSMCRTAWHRAVVAERKAGGPRRVAAMYWGETATVSGCGELSVSTQQGTPCSDWERESGWRKIGLFRAARTVCAGFAGRVGSVVSTSDALMRASDGCPCCGCEGSSRSTRLEPSHAGTRLVVILSLMRDPVVHLLLRSRQVPSLTW